MHPQQQQQLLLCRQQQQQLAQASNNVQDVGTALSVTVRFLTAIDSKLSLMNDKLDEIKKSVGDMQGALQRLIGKRAMDRLDEIREDHRQRVGQLPERIYVPHGGLAFGESSKAFQETTEHPRFPLLPFVADFLRDPRRSVREFVCVRGCACLYV